MNLKWQWNLIRQQATETGAAPAATETPATEQPAAEGLPAPVPSLLGGEEPQPEGDKPAGETPKEPSAAQVDVKALKIPDGFEAKPEVLDQFGTLANEFGLDQEKAQKLLDLHADVIREAAKAPYTQWNQTQTKWVDEVKADPVIGGDRLQGTLTTISRVLDQFGDPKVKEALAFTGAGNNPAIIRTLHKMAEKLTEGGFVAGVPAGQTKPQPGPNAMYPNLPQGR